MKYGLKLALALLALPVLGVVSSQNAAAQCGGMATKASFSSRALMFQGSVRGSVKTAGYVEDRSTQWGEERGENGLEPIVGLWKIEFVDQSKNYIDKGYAAWHSDFTEFQNSERTPSTGAVCQGVWEKVGRSTYRLNHFALAYGDSFNLTNIIQIREEVTVDKSRRNFTGTFTTKVYDTSHNLLVTFRGPITGKRVTIDSGIESQ